MIVDHSAEAVSREDTHDPSADPDTMRTAHIALLGCGTVGSAIARLLVDLRERMRIAHRVDLRLTKALVRDDSKRREGVDPRLLTRDFDDVLRAGPDVIIEVLGGREPATTFVRRALRQGISVVSANKTLIAHDAPALERIAQRQRQRQRQTGSRPSAGPYLLHEAAVAAAVPILAAVRQRAGDPLIALRAVLNGTCNFILSRMGETGGTFEQALSEATALGLAEPDPAADITGRDAAEKLCILARALGFANIALRDIVVEGIAGVTPRDLRAAREHGCVIRLVAELEPAADAGANASPRLRVGPALAPITHPLAKARGAENVIVLDQEFAGRLVLHGEGAGPRPTAAAILGDVLRALGADPAHAPSTRLSPSARGCTRRALVRTPRAGAEGEFADAFAGASFVQIGDRHVEAIVDEKRAAAMCGRASTLVAAIVR